MYSNIVPLDEAASHGRLQNPVQYSAMRQLNDRPWWPLGFEELIKTEKQKGLHLKLETSEFSLINYLLG